MSEASLAAQRVAVQAMRSRPQLLALVPSANIFDRHQRPEIFPSIIVGEGQTVADEADCITGSEVFLQLHVWTRENSFVDCKSIAGEIRRALKGVDEVRDGHEVSLEFDDSTFLRDPGGELSHGILRFTALTEDIVGI